MSQFFVDVTAGSLPPVVATSYVTDVNSPAIPAGNVLNEVGGQTTANNNNGIRTDGSSGSNTLTVQLTNRASVTGTTIGAVNTDVTIFTPTVNTVYLYSVSIAGRDIVSGDATGGALFGLGKKGAGAASVVGDNDALDEGDASLIATDWDIIPGGVGNADIIVRFTGVAGRTINWRCTFTYIQVS